VVARLKAGITLDHLRRHRAPGFQAEKVQAAEFVGLSATSGGSRQKMLSAAWNPGLQ